MAFNATLEIKNKERKLLQLNKGYFFVRSSLLIDWSKKHSFGTHDELKRVTYL